MSKWLQWWGLSMLTGSPLGSLLILVVAWWLLDRFTLGILPDPVRAWARYRRVGQLRERLGAAPADRRARLELGELLVEQRRFAAARDVLQPNVDAGDDDVYTMFAMGTALAGMGKPEEAERFLTRAQVREANFRMNAIDLEMGRTRLAAGNFRGAAEALERLCRARPSSVEGRVLLSRALEGMGEQQRAQQARDDAWNEYASAPGFQKRRERWWAWRARPLRPVMYLVVALLVGGVFARVVGPMVGSAPPAAAASDE